MKKIILLGWMMVFLLSACDKEDDTLTPDERPDARLNTALAEYKELLTGAEWGWKATLYPDGGSRYSFLFTFSENDRVKMLSDINSSTAGEVFESTYRLKAMQKPSLLFDTYSYLHILADPDERKSGGDRGEGRYSDFEFSFKETSDNTIELIGNYNGSRLILEKATQEEAENYIQNIGAIIAEFERLNDFTTYFKRLNFGGKSIDVEANTQSRTISFFYYDGNIRRSFITDYYYSEEGIVLLEPFVNDNTTIRTLENIDYSPSNNEIILKVNNLSGSIREAQKPLKSDFLAGRDFANNPPNGSYAISISGFTVENEEDSFDLSSIDNYYFLVYWPRFPGVEESNELAGEQVDLFGFILLNELEQRVEIGYGPLLNTTSTNDGRVIFTKLGEHKETPAQALPMVTPTIEQLVIPEGYYVIRTAEGGFDLVSASDAKAWISFF